MSVVRVGAPLIARDLAIWGILAAVTFFALWPALWVLGPGEVFARIVAFTRETGGQPDEVGSFFLGQVGADPGPFYYPVSTLFRLSPFATLGLALSAVLVWRSSRETLLRAGWLLVFAGGFGLMMTLGPKKFDRYLLPAVPMLVILASLGWWLLLARLAQPAARIALGIVLGVVLVFPLASVYPYPLAFYNPLLGGGAVAQRAVMVGNGEGLDQVARWLNARPNAPDLWVISDSFDILQALIVSSGESLRDRVPSNADYVVLYRFQTQIGHSPRVLDEYLNRRTPELVVTINGVDYARVYRGPHLLAQDEIQAAAIAEAGPAPNPDLDADDDDTPASSAVFAGWREQVKPRLRRLRTYATGLLTSSSRATR